MESLPAESSARSVASSRLVAGWLAVDPVAASQWVIDQPDSPGRTGAIEALANSITAEDPESAVIWSLELPDGRSQYATLGRALKCYPQTEPVVY